MIFILVKTQEKGRPQLILSLTSRAYLLYFILTSVFGYDGGNSVSDPILASNGVKQGGVLSPVLFAVYMDVLTERMKKSSYGCQMGNLFMETFGYADNIVTLAPTISYLSKLLEVANELCKEYNVKFNPEKFQLVAFGYSGNIDDIVMCFDVNVIKCQPIADHLGNILEEKGDNGISRLIDDFTAKVNGIISLFQSEHFQTKYVLFKTLCMPLYGAILLDLSGDMVNAVWVRWRKCLRRSTKQDT